MKKTIVILLLTISLFSYGQYTSGFLQETFFGRQPSARAEALGKGYNSIDGDLASIFYNPAGTATMQGIEMNTSFASPFYMLDEASYSFLSVGYNLNQYLSFGFSRNHFDFGEEIQYEQYTPMNSIYTINISSQPIKGILVGLNANYLSNNYGNNPNSSLYFDFGLIKKFQIVQNEGFTHSIDLGASIDNLNFAEIDFDKDDSEPGVPLPVITRYGANYQMDLDRRWLSDSLCTFRFLLIGEYQMLLNSDYHKGFHSGAELMLLEILSIRFGYYSESVDDHGLPESNKGSINAWTYGFGIQIPIQKLTRIPLLFNIDFTTLPQVNYTQRLQDLGNFSTYTFRVNLLL